MATESRGRATFIGRRGQIPGPTPVTVPTRRNHVAELFSRLSLGTAGSRARHDVKYSPAINSGNKEQFGNFGGAFAVQQQQPHAYPKQSRPTIGRPQQVMSSTGATAHHVASFAAAVQTPASPAVSTTATATARTINKRVPVTTAKARIPKPTTISPTRTPKMAIATAMAAGEAGRASPYKTTKTVGRSSALGRGSAMGRSSALRNPARAPGFSRVQELKLKVAELEGVMSRAAADKELIAAQATRIRELEEQFRHSTDDTSIASASSPTISSPAMRRVSILAPGEKWEFQEQQFKQREETIRIREERVARAETQAKAAAADARAAVLEKDAMAGRLDKLKEIHQKDRLKLEDLHEQLDAMTASRDSLQRQVTAFQVSQRTLEKQLTISQRDTRRSKRVMVALEQNVNDLKITIEEKNMENDELNRSITRVMQQAASVLRPNSAELDIAPL